MAHEDVVSRATAALKASVTSIINCDDDDATKRTALAETFTQFATYLDRNGGGDIVEKAGGGAHDLAGALLRHLHDRLEAKRERHGFEKRKEGPLDQHQELISIMKAHGPVGLCKGIIDRGRSPCDEPALVAALTKAASDQYSSLRPDTAFAKLYEAEESVRRACNIAKAAGPMFDVTIVHPGDETYRTVNDTESSEAYQQLEALASKLHAAATGKMSKEQAFARAFESRPDLAVKAHRRPQATTFFPHPR
jgi:hypothetical protein